MSTPHISSALAYTDNNSTSKPHTYSLEAVTQHQQQGQALALLVGTRRGLGGLQVR